MSEAQPSPANRRKDLITEFRETYATAYAEAEVSAAHTGTEGWRKLYALRRKEEAAERRKLADDLKRLATAMEETGIGEDGEKELADTKKKSAEIREQRDAFDTDTVGPVKRPAVECGKILEDFRERARNREDAHPLIEVGLLDLMREAVKEAPKVRWDGETGRVIVGETASAAGR